ADRRIGTDNEGDIFAIEDRERREPPGVRRGHPGQVIGRHSGRADPDHMTIAGMALDMAPRLAAAIAAHIDYLDRDIDEPAGADGVAQCPRRAVEAATRRRARDDLDRPLRLPRHRQFAGLIAPSTRAQRSTSLRMKSSKAAGERCGTGTTS